MRKARLMIWCTGAIGVPIVWRRSTRYDCEVPLLCIAPRPSLPIRNPRECHTGTPVGLEAEGPFAMPLRPSFMARKCSHAWAFASGQIRISHVIRFKGLDWAWKQAFQINCESLVFVPSAELSSKCNTTTQSQDFVYNLSDVDMWLLWRCSSGGNYRSFPPSSVAMLMHEAQDVYFIHPCQLTTALRKKEVRGTLS